MKNPRHYFLGKRLFLQPAKTKHVKPPPIKAAPARRYSLGLEAQIERRPAK